MGETIDNRASQEEEWIIMNSSHHYDEFIDFFMGMDMDHRPSIDHRIVRDVILAGSFAFQLAIICTAVW